MDQAGQGLGKRCWHETRTGRRFLVSMLRKGTAYKWITSTRFDSEGATACLICGRQISGTTSQLTSCATRAKGRSKGRGGNMPGHIPAHQKPKPKKKKKKKKKS